MILLPNHRLLEPSEYRRWDDFVSHSENGHIYNTSRYAELLTNATGDTYRLLVQEDSEGISGGVLLYQLRMKRLPYVSNRLLLYYNGVVGRTKDALRLDDLLRCLEQMRYGRLHLHTSGEIVLPVESLARGWTTSSTGTYVVAIDDVAALWARLDKNARRLVRRAEEAGVTVTADNDFENLFSLHNEIHRRKGAPLYLPHDSFRGFCDGLIKEGLGCIITARSVHGEPLASQLVLTGPFLTTHTVCAGSAEEGLSVGATPYLRWRAFEFLSQRGYLFNDLTDASLPEVARFKKQLGGALKTNTVVRFRDSLPFRAIEALSKFRETVRRRA